MKKILLLFFLFMISELSFAQNLNRLTENILWKLRRLSDYQLSPDGSLVLYTVRSFNITENKGHNEVFLLKLTEGGAVKVLSEELNANNAKFSPDGKKILFLSSKGGSSQIYSTELDGSELHELSHIRGGIDGFAFSPDLKHVLYIKSVQVDKTVAEEYPELSKSTGRIYDGLNYRHWDTWKDGSYSHLFVSELEDGKIEVGSDIMKSEPYDAPNPPDGGEEQFAWSPDGGSIVYSCKKESGTAYMTSTNTDLFRYDLSTKKTQNLTVGMNGYDTNPSFSPDGKMLAWLSMKTPGYESDRNRVMMMNLADGKMTEATASSDQFADSFSWSRDGKKLFIVLVEEATKPVYAYTLADQSLKKFASGPQDYGNIQQALTNGKTILIAEMTTISKPADLVQLDESTGEQKPLTQLNQDILGEIKLGKVEKRMVSATDGKKILTWVVYPPDFDATKKYPALLLCQGGPQVPVSQAFSFRWNYQVMASHGYIVVAPNRRGLPGFGSKWNDEIAHDYGGQPMKDLLSSIDDVAKEPYVNKDKLGCVGASFGGYSVYWMAGNHHKRFKVFIAHDGMFNMTSWYGSTEEMWFANHDNGPYWKNKENYEKFSPHNFVQNWDTPILIITNEKDYRVPVEQGLEAFTAAQIKGIPSRLLSFPDENHWVLKPQNSLLWNMVFYDWLDKYLKD